MCEGCYRPRWQLCYLLGWNHSALGGSEQPKWSIKFHFDSPNNCKSTKTTGAIRSRIGKWDPTEIIDLPESTKWELNPWDKLVKLKDHHHLQWDLGNGAPLKISGQTMRLMDATSNQEMKEICSKSQGRDNLINKDPTNQWKILGWRSKCLWKEHSRY